MGQRTRTRTQQSVRGSIWVPTWNGVSNDWSEVEGAQSYATSMSQCTDFVGKEANWFTGRLPSTPLDITHVRWFIQGMRGFNGFFWDFRDRLPDFPVGRIPGLVEPAIPRDKGNDVYAVETLARTHPFRPEFSVPVFAKELVETAALVELKMKSFVSYVGGQYLNYQFGWKTFVRDIKTLHTITQAIEDRMRAASSLVQHGGLRSKVELDSWSAKLDFENVAFNSTWAAYINGNTHHRTSVKVWGTCRWSPTLEYVIPLDGITNFNRQCTIAFDLGDIDAATAWQMIPFSWLVDYFVKVGDSLQAIADSQYVKPHDLCIMREYRTELRGIPDNNPGYMHPDGGGFVINRVDKTRHVVDSVDYPPIVFSHLNRGQLLNMAALLARLRG
jgi:hypothetical protein